MAWYSVKHRNNFTFTFNNLWSVCYMTITLSFTLHKAIKAHHCFYTVKEMDVDSIWVGMAASLKTKMMMGG